MPNGDRFTLYFQIFVSVTSSGKTKMSLHCLNTLATETSYLGKNNQKTCAKKHWIGRILGPHSIKIKADRIVEDIFI